MKGMTDDPTVIGSSQDAHWNVGADLLSSCGYVVAVFIWSIVQFCRRDYAELEAGLVVLEAAADLSVIHVFATTVNKSTRVVTVALGVFGVMMHHASPIHNTRHVTPSTSATAPTLAPPAFKLAVGVNLLIVAVFTLVGTFATFPLDTKDRSGLTAFLLGALWLFNNEFGTYTTIPHTGTGFISLDQLRPLGGALLVIGWSWKAESKTAWN